MSAVSHYDYSIEERSNVYTLNLYIIFKLSSGVTIRLSAHKAGLIYSFSTRCILRQHQLHVKDFYAFQCCVTAYGFISKLTRYREHDPPLRRAL